MPNFAGNIAALQEYTALLETFLDKVFKDALPTHKTLYDGWLKTKKAKQFLERDAIATGFGPMPEKGIGGVFVTDQPILSDPKERVVKTYGLGFVAEYELIRWARHGVFVNITKKLARSGVDRKNVIAHSILNNAFSSSDPVYATYAGEALVSDSHALLRGGATGKNKPSAPVALSYLGMQEAITDYAMMVNEDGLFISLSPSNVVVHPSKAWVLETLLGSQYRPDNANMNKNTLSGSGLSAISSSPYLSSEDAWFVLADKDTLDLHSGIAFEVGDDLEFRRGYEQATWNTTFTMYGAFRISTMTWYGIWGSEGV